MKSLLKPLQQRLQLTFAWSETGMVRTVHVPAWAAVSSALASITVIGALALNTSSQSTEVYVPGESQTAKTSVKQLEAENNYLEKQLQVIGQELGVLQARLDRFDVIGEQLFSAELFADIAENRADAPADGIDTTSEPLSEVFGGKGGPGKIDFNAPVDAENMLRELAGLKAKTDHTEATLQAGLALVTRDTMANSQRPQLFPVVHPRAWVSSPYGWRKDPFGGQKAWHGGIDVAAAMNAPIVASADGYVAFTGYRYGYGILVELRHANGISTRYAHLAKSTVQHGDVIKAGDLVGLMGSTGRSTGPHLHFEILVADRKVNPYPFVKETRMSQRASARAGEMDRLLALVSQ